MKQEMRICRQQNGQKEKQYFVIIQGAARKKIVKQAFLNKYKHLIFRFHPLY